MQLNFIQSNWLRQYPFRYDQGLMDLNNNEVPADIIVAVKITCGPADPDIYINKIYTHAGKVGVGFAGTNGDIGYASGVINSANQSLIIKNYNGGSIGSVTIGNPFRTQLPQNFIFDNTCGLIEPSTILVLPVPVVSKVTVKGVTYTGSVSLTSTSLGISTSSTLNIAVINPAIIESRGDQRAEYLTCSNTTISGINSVTPDKNGNIDIYAIAPLVVTVTTINGIQQLQLTTPTLGINDTDPDIGNLCKLINNPPINNTDTYPAISGVTIPEWQTWPQYE